MKLKYWPENGTPKSTSLWRYMSLGTFFLLLNRNKVFVPSLKKLQESDPKEMRVPLGSDADIGQFRSSGVFLELRKWLAKNTLSSRNEIDEWIYQLSVRRGCWCWFSPGKTPANWYESMAMWSFYARNGVAIKTTLENICAAFREPDLTEMLVAEVEYCIPRVPSRSFYNHEYATRPFLFKSASYRHESEVRLVLQLNAGSPEAGLKVNIDAKALLEGGQVIISPFMVPDEQRAVIEVAKQLLPDVTVSFRASSELSSDAGDSFHFLDSFDEIERLAQPFQRETGLPGLLGEL